MTSIPERARTIAALKVIDDLVKRQTGTDKQSLLDALRELGVKGAVDAVMPDGTHLGRVTVCKGKTAAKVTDYDALTEWVTEHHPHQVVTVTSVRPAFIASLLKSAQDAGEPVDSSGEVVPGVEVFEGSPYLSTSLAHGAAEVVLAAVRSGVLQPLALPGGEP